MSVSDDAKGMLDILNKLHNTVENKQAITENQTKPTTRSTGRPEVDEMYNILSKLEEATNNAAEYIVVEEDEEINKNFGVGNLNIELIDTTVSGYKKTYYNIVKDNIIIHKELALFETAMTIVKGYITENEKNIDKLLELDSRYDSNLLEAAGYKKRIRNLTESNAFKQDVYLAKHSTAIKKMRAIKAEIKKML